MSDRIEHLKKLIKLAEKKIFSLQEALILSTDASIRFKYEYELEAEQEKLGKLNAELKGLGVILSDTEDNAENTEETEIKRPKKVFISYSHKDSNFVNILKMHLEIHLEVLSKKENISFIIDTEHLKYADNFEEFIRKSVKKSNYTLVIISKNSLRSPWVIKECVEALKYEDILEEKKFFPIFIDDDFLENSFLYQITEYLEKEIEDISDEIKKLLDRNIDFNSLMYKRNLLTYMYKNIDTVLTTLRRRLAADFTTAEKTLENLPKVIKFLKS